MPGPSGSPDPSSRHLKTTTERVLTWGLRGVPTVPGRRVGRTPVELRSTPGNNSGVWRLYNRKTHVNVSLGVKGPKKEYSVSSEVSPTLLTGTGGRTFREP